MKNLFLSLTLLLVSSIALANNSMSSNDDFKGEILIEQSCENETNEIKLNFNDFNDFYNFDVNQIDLIDDCEVTVEVTVKATIGVASVSVTLKATVPCDEIKQTVKDLKKEAKEALGL